MSYVKICEVCGDEFIAKRSDARCCSRRCRDRKRNKSFKVKACKLCGKEFKGHGNELYCSVKCKENAYGRNKYKFSVWKKAVKERDIVCQLCGNIHNLEAHHIVPKSVNEDLKYDLDNGILLCDECHRVGKVAIHRVLLTDYNSEEFYIWMKVAKKYL